MKLSSFNEWDKLREVILGSVEHFSPALEAAYGGYANLDAAREIAMLAYPQWYLDEVAEDLEALGSTLRQAGVTVHRPGWNEARPDFQTPNWCASGFDIYNVRDLHVVVGNTLISSAPSSRFRLFEHHAIQNLVYDHYFEQGLQWIYAPPPRLAGEYLVEREMARTALETDEEWRHRQLSHGLTEKFHRLLENEIIFDAANIMRFGRDILFLVSSTGNQLAGKWLQQALGSEYRVHVTSAYRSSHLDSTILPLRPGLVLLNSARVNSDNCPPFLSGWEQLYFSDVAPVPEAEVDFHRKVRLPVHHRLLSMGVESQLGHISSAWAGLNVLSLSPDTVLVHDRQKALIRELERKKLTVIPIRMRHCYTMLGGLHCSTLDTVRDGTLESGA